MSTFLPIATIPTAASTSSTAGSSSAEPLNAAQSARLLREAHAADRRANARLEAIQEH